MWGARFFRLTDLRPVGVSVQPSIMPALSRASASSASLLRSNSPSREKIYSLAFCWAG